jgi:hypothetical protein
MITNIGTFGLSYGMVALFPIGKIPAVITMGKIEENPVVIDGEIKIRKMLPLDRHFRSSHCGRRPGGRVGKWSCPAPGKSRGTG